MEPFTKVTGTKILKRANAKLSTLMAINLKEMSMRKIKKDQLFGDSGRFKAS